MNYVDVNDQLVNIAQVARKCPGPTLRRAYMRAYREWCQQTQWLRTDVPGATVQGIRQYSLGNDPNLDIIGVFAMQGSWTQGSGYVQYWPIVPSNSSTWNPNLTQGQPVRFQYVPEAQFALDPSPQQVYQLSITIIVAPKETAVIVPESPLIKYSNDIEAGALEYLLAIPGMPWTNPQMAQLKGREFRSGISNGKAEAQRSYNVGAQRAQPRRFIL